MRSAATQGRFRHGWRSLLSACILCSVLSGCNYVLILGYLIGGPPSVEPDFDKETKECMTDKDVTVAVVCFAPNEVLFSFENVDHELAKYVSFRLSEHKIKIVPPDYVKAWLEENKDWDKPEEIGAHFKATHSAFIAMTHIWRTSTVRQPNRRLKLNRICTLCWTKPSRFATPQTELSIRRPVHLSFFGVVVVERIAFQQPTRLRLRLH